MTFRLRLTLLAVGFAALAALTSAAIPLYEAPDETIHLDYVFALRQGSGLPVMTGDPATTVGGQEAFHPPLYYAVAALLALPADPTGYREAQRINWYQQFDRRQAGNANVVIHGAEPPGPSLAIHLARLASVLFGTATIVFSGLAAREAGLGDGLALLTSAFVAAVPQFVFVSAVANADSAAIAASTATLYLALRLLARPVTNLGVVVLGAAGGLAAMTKVSGALSGALALGALILARRIQRTRRPLLTDLALLAAPAALITGWWFARNVLLYGDPLGWNQMLILIDAIVRRDPSPSEILAETVKLRESSWALFGWGNVGLPDWAYFLFDAVVLLGLVGWGWRLLRRPVDWRDGRTPLPTAALLLVGWIAVYALFLARWIVVNEHGGQGRLWFPAIAAFSILLLSGLAALVPRRPLMLPACVVGGLAVLAILAPWLVILPAYAVPASPTVLAEASGPARFGEIELIGYRLEPETIQPGGQGTLWLWWRTERADTRDLAVRLRVLARDFRPVVETISYPGAGTLPIDRWTVGALVTDPHRLRIPRSLDAPDYLRIEVSLVDRASGEALVVGNERHLTLGPWRVEGTGPWPPAGVAPASLRLDGRLDLTGATVELYPPEAPNSGGSIAVLLYWTAQAPAAGARATLSLVDPTGRTVVSADRALGTWHRIADWRAGDHFVDELDLDLPASLPAGEYAVWLAAAADGVQGVATVGAVRR
ncbi:MAG: DUF2142 domain-containing protein [Dehalococcoidia bacterium]